MSSRTDQADRLIGELLHTERLAVTDVEPMHMKTAWFSVSVARTMAAATSSRMDEIATMFAAAEEDDLLALGGL